jgi:hypothetical protein
MTARILSVVLDYSVIDHLQRIEAGSYGGRNKDALQRLRVAAEAGRVEIWGSEITFVEMIRGIENLAGREERKKIVAIKDEAKRVIMDKMGVRRLGYPCSRCDDAFSRLDVSFRCAGPNTDQAMLLESKSGDLERRSSFSRTPPGR